MDFSYEHFVDCLDAGDQREFWYGERILVVRSEKKKSIFSIEYLGKIVFEQSYDTPQQLLDSVRVDNKTLKEIWNELRIA